MSELFWHRVSEKEKEEIQKQAKFIMDSFSKKLEKVKFQLEIDGIKRDEFERVEKDMKSQEMNREIMFENAPGKKGDFILGEKGKW